MGNVFAIRPLQGLQPFSGPSSVLAPRASRASQPQHTHRKPRASRSLALASSLALELAYILNPGMHLSSHAPNPNGFPWGSGPASASRPASGPSPCLGNSCVFYYRITLRLTQSIRTTTFSSRSHLACSALGCPLLGHTNFPLAPISHLYSKFTVEFSETGARHDH